MSCTTKESLYDLLTDLESVYPEAAAAFRVAVAELPEEDMEKVVRCRNCAAYTTEIAGRPISWCCRHERITYTDDFCSDGELKGGAE